MHRFVALAAMVLGVGCGGESASKVPDAAIDAGPDAPMPPAFHYVADGIRVPTTNTEAREYGLDLNGDGTIDNQAGMVLSTLSGMGIPIAADNTAAVDRGTAITLLHVATFDFMDSQYAYAAVLVGKNPVPAACTDAGDTLCRHHLDGTASFDIVPSNATLMPGSFVNTIGLAGPGRATLQLAFAGITPTLIPMIGTRIKVLGSATALMSGVLAGAIVSADIDTKIIPGMRDSFAPIIVRDCTMLSSPPGCGCAQDSTGKTLLGLFDVSPKDCAVTSNEIKNNSLIQSLLAPDVMIEGQPALSIGVGFTAVGATFSYP